MSFHMPVSDVFFIRGRGVVATGQVQAGSIRKGDNVQINGGDPVRVDGIEAFRKQLDEANQGDNIGLLFTSLDKGDLNRGDMVTVGEVVLPDAPNAPPAAGGLPDWPGGLPPG